MTSLIFHGFLESYFVLDALNEAMILRSFTIEVLHFIFSIVILCLCYFLLIILELFVISIASSTFSYGILLYKIDLYCIFNLILCCPPALPHHFLSSNHYTLSITQFSLTCSSSNNHNLHTSPYLPLFSHSGPLSI